MPQEQTETLTQGPAANIRKTSKLVKEAGAGWVTVVRVTAVLTDAVFAVSLCQVSDHLTRRAQNQGES